MKWRNFELFLKKCCRKNDTWYINYNLKNSEIKKMLKSNNCLIYILQNTHGTSIAYANLIQHGTTIEN